MTDNAVKTGLTIGRAVREMRNAFAQAGLGTPGLDARILAAHVTGTDPALSLIDPACPVDERFAKLLEAASVRRLAGEPVHRIIGRRDFYGLPLRLGPDTLEPRPDTETLVEAVLPFVRRVIEQKGSCRVLDLGTGTGAVGLAIAWQNADAEIVGTDIAAGAVEIANGNARSLGVANRYRAIRSDWFSAVEGKFDLIVSNPPYIRSAQIGLLEREVRDHDPRRALDGGPDGLDAYRAIARGAARHLLEGTRIAVEIGAGQAKTVQAIFRRHGLSCAKCVDDLGGMERVLVFRAMPAIC